MCKKYNYLYFKFSLSLNIFQSLFISFSLLEMTFFSPYKNIHVLLENKLQQTHYSKTKVTPNSPYSVLL